MKTKKVVIDGVEYEIKKLTFGEYNQLLKLSTKVHVENGKTYTDIDGAVFQEKLLFFCLIKPEKYYRKQDEINKIDYETAVKLVNEAMEFNGLSDKKKSE